MTKLLLTLAACTSFVAHSQIIGPDTVCVGSSAQFTTTQEAVSYTWTLDSVNIIQPPGVQVSAASSSLISGCFTTLNNDNGHYYSFTTQYGGSSVIKVDYGNSPLNTPTITNMGSFGLTNGQTSGIDVVKDPGGTWWGIVTGGSQMLRLNFGSSLANVPTATLWTYPANLAWPHHMFIKKYGSTWLVFVANRNGAVSRFDFGSSMGNTPTAVNLPYVGGYTSPSNMSLYQQGNDWYMLVSNLLDASMTRLEFGPNLQNNNPTGTYLGNVNSLFGLPRGNSVLADCDAQLIAYELNEGGSFNRLNFQGNITNNPTGQNVGFLSGSSIYNGILPFTYNGILYYLCTHTSTNSLVRVPVLNYPPQTVTNYYNPNFAHTFTATGIYNITLHCDQGFPSGPSAYCKQVVVVPGNTTVNLGNDVTVCNSSYTLNPTVTGGGSFQWSTGATTPTINVTSSGTYWVTVTGSCGVSSDTVNVTLLSTLPTVSLGNDTTICFPSYTLNPVVTNATAYQWSTGATTQSIQITNSGTYWIKAIGPCGATVDTVTITLLPQLIVDISPDTTVCQGQSVTLHASGNYVTPTMLWSNGSNGTNITVNQTGNYWLQVTQGPCIATDSTTVTVLDPPLVNLGNDQSFCEGGSVLLQPTPQYNNGSYLWSNGSTNNAIGVNQAGTYWLYISLLPGCDGSDTINITEVQNPVVTINNDTALCPGEATTLQAQGSFSNPSYLWNTGSTTAAITVSDPGTYWLAVTVNGCTGTDSANITEAPTPPVDINGADSLCPGMTTTLSSVQPNGSTYLWSNGSSAANITVDTGIHWLMVTNTNGCTASDTIEVRYYMPPSIILPADTIICQGDMFTLYPSYYHGELTWNNNNVNYGIVVSGAGTYIVTASNTCESVTDSITINTQLCDLWVPNSFTPNGDGKNDIFRLVGNLHLVTDLYFAIYNRFGERVFETEDPYKGWDGRFRNNNQDLGTFGYMVKCKVANRNVEMKGFLHLIR